MDTVPEFHAEAPQATVSEGLSQGPYMAARAGVEPVTLRTKGVDSIKVPPSPTDALWCMYSDTQIPIELVLICIWKTLWDLLQHRHADVVETSFSRTCSQSSVNYYEELSFRSACRQFTDSGFWWMDGGRSSGSAIGRSSQILQIRPSFTRQLRLMPLPHPSIQANLVITCCHRTAETEDEVPGLWVVDLSHFFRELWGGRTIASFTAGQTPLCSQSRPCVKGENSKRHLGCCWKRTMI